MTSSKRVHSVCSNLFVPSRNISLAVLEQEEAEFKAARDKLLASRQQEAIRRQVRDYTAVVPVLDERVAGIDKYRGKIQCPNL